MSETKKCPYCADEIALVDVKCKHCSEYLDNLKNTNITVPAKAESIFTKPIGGKAVLFILMILVICVGFFHIVPDRLAILPKAHFTYSHTFVDVDEVIDRYNSQALGERMKGNELFDNLIFKLKERGIITLTSERKHIDLNY